MNQHKATYDRLVAMWDTQDSLLQSYRNIFLTSQSIIFSIAVFIASGTQLFWFAFFLMPLAIYLLGLWLNLCRRRGHGVWFFQWQILRLENGQSVDQNMFSAYREWQALGAKKQRERLGNDELGKGLLKAPIRVKIDQILPYVFGVLWGILGLLIVVMLFV